jgi:amino acid transporter
MIANAAEEAKNPRRDVPLATALCLGMCTALYVAASTVIAGKHSQQGQLSYCL